MGSFGQYQDFNCDNNPLLCGWTMVFIPYCTQDLHGGKVTVPSDDSWGLYFTGTFVFRAVVQELDAKYNLTSATEIILTGEPVEVYCSSFSLTHKGVRTCLHTRSQTCKHTSRPHTHTTHAHTHSRTHTLTHTHTSTHTHSHKHTHSHTHSLSLWSAGQSAGGIGVWYHLDWLSNKYPAARVVGAPIAGFYFPVRSKRVHTESLRESERQAEKKQHTHTRTHAHTSSNPTILPTSPPLSLSLSHQAYPYTGINHTSSGLADFRPQAWPSHYKLWNSTVDEDCYRAHVTQPWLCMLSNVSFDFVSTPTFITEAQTDQVRACVCACTSVAMAVAVSV